MLARLQFSGPAQFRARSAALLSRALVDVTLRRLLRGPRRPGWNFVLEAGVEILKRQLHAAFQMRNVKDARRFLDTAVLRSPVVSQVKITDVLLDSFRGSWIIPRDEKPRATVLYLHGGGYSFYPRIAYKNLIAQFALSAKSRTFALDYRLSPEYRYPAQLEDALNAYRWLLETVSPKELVVAGDSAGANLTLALLLSAREAHLPLPALAITLSPPTNFEGDLSKPNLGEYDWIDKEMLTRWSGWFCLAAEACDPLVSPIGADLRGLPPIYMQDGGAEILHNSIQAFADHAKSEGADVTLETWPEMVHDFQMFGDEVPQSAEAFRRIGEVVQQQVANAKEIAIGNL